MDKKIKITFKNEARLTGLSGVGYPHRNTQIKINNKKFGYIRPPNWTTKDNKWEIFFAIVTENRNGWKWVQIKDRFDSTELAKVYIQDHIEEICKTHTLYFFEENR